MFFPLAVVLLIVGPVLVVDTLRGSSLVKRRTRDLAGCSCSEENPSLLNAELLKGRNGGDELNGLAIGGSYEFTWRASCKLRRDLR